MAASKAKGKKQAKPKKPVGRPSLYCEKLADVICERIADGESLRSICSAEAMPNRSTVFRWLAENAKFRDQYARAHEEQADVRFEEVIEIADEVCTMIRADKHGTADDDGNGNTEVVFDSAAVARNRLRVDARKWAAAKLAPKKYGEKLDVSGRLGLTLERLVTGEAAAE